MKKEMMVLVVSILVYSFVALAYLHNTFVGKDVFNFVVNKLNTIDRKIDVIMDKMHHTKE